MPTDRTASAFGGLVFIFVVVPLMLVALASELIPAHREASTEAQTRQVLRDTVVQLQNAGGDLEQMLQRCGDMRPADGWSVRCSKLAARTTPHGYSTAGVLVVVNHESGSSLAEKLPHNRL